MKKRFLLSGFCIVLFLAANKVDAQTIISRPIGLCELVFEDNFDSTALNTANWDVRKDSANWSRQKAENATVANGYLYLNGKKETVGGTSYTGAGVVTKKGFRYGYYECRFRVPKGKGWNTSLMVKNYIPENGVAYDETFQEINVCENNSINPLSFDTNLKNYYPRLTVSGAQSTSTGNLSAAFQIWGCELTPTSVNYYFNGKLIRTIDASKYRIGDASIWISSIASNLDGTSSVDDSQLPSAAVVDYVRFYKQLNPIFPDTITADSTSVLPIPGSHQLIVDNLDSLSCLYDTKWMPSTGVSGYYGSNYFYSPAANPKHWAKFMPNIASDDLYRVFLRWTEHQNRSNAVPIDIAHTNGLTFLYVDQRKNGGKWNYLGTYHFPKGRYGFVNIRGVTSGAAVADAALFERVDIPTGLGSNGANSEHQIQVSASSGIISLNLGQKSVVTLTIHNATGSRACDILTLQEREAGSYSYKIPSLSKGIFIATLYVNGKLVTSRKFIL